MKKFVPPWAEAGPLLAIRDSSTAVKTTKRKSRVFITLLR
jgi:hypothetical protein